MALEEHEGAAVFQTGDVSWRIIDDGRQPEFTDLVTEVRLVNGVIYLTLASTVMDGGGIPQAYIASRLRMSLAAGQFLNNALSGTLSAALSPDVGEGIN